MITSKQIAIEINGYPILNETHQAFDKLLLSEFEDYNSSMLLIGNYGRKLTIDGDFYEKNKSKFDFILKIWNIAFDCGLDFHNLCEMLPD